MGAVQGQNFPASLRAVALRAGTDVATVGRSVDKKDIVRCWPQRGTLHLVPAVDARWMMRLAGRRPSPKYLADAGLTAADLTTARAALRAALGGREMTRPDMYTVFADAGIDMGDRRGPRIVRVLGAEGELVHDRDHFFLVDDLPVPAAEPDDPLALLVQRFVDSHGPVTLADLKWWTGLGARKLQPALERAAGVVEDRGYWVGQWQRDVSDQELSAALEAEIRLPAFDEYLLGYQDKSFALPERLRPQVLTRNGLSWPFVVRGGIVTGRAVD